MSRKPLNGARQLTSGGRFAFGVLVFGLFRTLFRVKHRAGRAVGDNVRALFIRLCESVLVFKRCILGIFDALSGLPGIAWLGIFSAGLAGFLFLYHNSSVSLFLFVTVKQCGIAHLFLLFSVIFPFGIGKAEMFICAACGTAAARCAVEKPELQEVRLIYVL